MGVVPGKDVPRARRRPHLSSRRKNVMTALTRILVQQAVVVRRGPTIEPILLAGLITATLWFMFALVIALSWWSGGRI
jgi:hypothetical protein